MTTKRKGWGGGRIPKSYQHAIATTIKAMETKGLIRFSEDGDTVEITTAGRIMAAAAEVEAMG